MDAPVRGPWNYSDTTDELNALQFFIQQMLNRLATIALVQVVKVTNAGGVSPVGVVDVKRLVSVLDGFGVPVDTGVQYNVPYFRLQGGTNAVILDPQVGDIGICAFCSRDSSSAVANKGPGNPGSDRTYDLADGMYFGGFLNGTPAQYVAFATGGITVVSPTKITLQAPNIEMNASTQFKVTSPDIQLVGDTTETGTLTASVDVVAGGKHLKTHTHSGVTPGGGNTGPPT